MLDDLRDNPLFSSKASDGVIAEVQEACRSLEQRVKGGTRAETNAAELMTAFLWSVFAQPRPTMIPPKRNDQNARGGEKGGFSLGWRFRRRGTKPIAALTAQRRCPLYAIAAIPNDDVKGSNRTQTAASPLAFCSQIAFDG